MASYASRVAGGSAHSNWSSIIINSKSSRATLAMIRKPHGSTHSSTIPPVSGSSMAMLLGGPLRRSMHSTVPARRSIMKSLLMGVKDNDEDEQVFLEAHSKLAARGKYVHEMLVHNVKPDAWSDYTALVAENFTRIHTDKSFKTALFGSWYTEIGPLDQAVHIWQYNNYPGYHETKDLLAQDEQYARFMHHLRPMLVSHKNQMVQEFDFWESTSPSVHNTQAEQYQGGGVYELRTYHLKPGRLMEWKNEWKKGLEARRKFIEPVGAWFSQIGELNVVHHMWFYPNLQVRKEMREKCWEVDGWAATTFNTVRLIDTMNSRVVRPFKFSPLS